MSFTVPSRRVAALALAASGLATVLSGAFAPAATAAPSTATAAASAPSVALAAKKSWFVDPRTPAQRKAQVAVPGKPEKYRGKLRETRAVYRTRDGALAVPMRYAFGNLVSKGQALTLDGGGLFSGGSATLTTSAKAQIRKLANSLTNASSVRCEGYADYSGPAGEAKSLSKARAAKVCAQLAKENPGLKTSSVSYGSARPAILGGVPAKRELNRRVVVEMTGTRPAKPAPTAPQAKVPGAPVLVHADGIDGAVRYGFNAPASDGGSPITGYQVSTGGPWVPVQILLGRRSTTSDTQLTPCRGCGPQAEFEANLGNLTPAQLVNLRVRAVNKVGAGAPSNTLSTKVYGRPSAPTGLEVVGDDRVITTTFGAPTDNGGSSIYLYEISYDGGVHWTPVQPTGDAPWTVTKEGLDNGTTYDVRVRAWNDWGFGKEAKDEVLVAAVPDAPGIDDPDPVGDRIDFTLVAPEYDGGRPVTGYEITIDGGETWDELTPEVGEGLHFSLTDLTLGHEYDVRVRAVNAHGKGKASKSRVFTPALAPSAPTGLVAEGDNGEMKVTFGPPAHDNGAEVTSYDVSFDGGVSWWYAVQLTGSAPWTYTMDGFVDGQTYDVRVRANNRIGHSTEASADDVLVASKPGIPSVYGVEPADTAAKLMFGAPQSDGGTEITAYEVSVDGGAWTELSVSPDVVLPHILRATVSDLVNGQQYGVRVRAVNARGAGEGSISVDVTPSTVPGAPKNVVATADGTTVTVSFDKGADGGSEILRHEVRVDEGPWETATVVDGKITLTDQVDGPHTYAVRAVNARGDSLATTSNEITVVAPPVVQPAAPTGLQRWGMGGMGDQGYYGLKFTPGATNGSTVIGWEARIDDGAWVSLVDVSEADGDVFGQVWFSCDGFCEMPMVDHEYVVVRAVTANGVSPASASAPLHLPEDGGGIP